MAPPAAAPDQPPAWSTPTTEVPGRGGHRQADHRQHRRPGPLHGPRFRPRVSPLPGLTGADEGHISERIVDNETQAKAQEAACCWRMGDWPSSATPTRRSSTSRVEDPGARR